MPPIKNHVTIDMKISMFVSVLLRVKRGCGALFPGAGFYSNTCTVMSTIGKRAPDAG